MVSDEFDKLVVFILASPPHLFIDGGSPDQLELRVPAVTKLPAAPA